MAKNKKNYLSGLNYNKIVENFRILFVEVSYEDFKSSCR